MKPLKKLALSALIAAAPAFSQSASVKKDVVLPNCAASLPIATADCFTRLRVTAHPSNDKVIGFVITVTYKDYLGFGLRTFTWTMYDRNPAGDFILDIPNGEVVVSGMELYGGQVVHEAQ